MIIDKVKPFYTEEDLQTIDDLFDLTEQYLKESQAIDSQIPIILQGTNPERVKKWRTSHESIVKRLDAAERERNKIYMAVEQRYIDSFSAAPATLYQEIDEIVKKIERKDFVSRMADLMASWPWNNVKKEAIPEALRESVEAEKTKFTKSQDTCYNFILKALRVQLNGLAYYNLDAEQACKIARTKAKRLYPGKGSYRTRAKAREAGAVDPVSEDHLLVPTLPGFENSFGLYHTRKSRMYVRPIKSPVFVEDGKIYVCLTGNQDGQDSKRKIAEADLIAIDDFKGVKNLDVTDLLCFYTIFFEQCSIKKALVDSIIIPARDLSVALGLNPNMTQEDIEKTLLPRVKKYHQYAGYIPDPDHAGRASIMTLLAFQGYNSRDNTVKFSSEYMRYVISEMFEAAKIKDRKGQEKLTASGEPQRRAINSYLVHKDISKERNKQAINIVCEIVRLFEQAAPASGNVPNIKAQTLIDRDPAFKIRLEMSKNPRTLLRSTWVKAWTLLKEKTDVPEKYPDIILPDPADPAWCPTPAMLESTVFRFETKAQKEE